jgi:hypothetical protein
MPMAKIYLREGTAPEHREAISEALHRSLVTVLGIPDDDRFHVFHELGDSYLFTAPVSFGLPRRREMILIQFHFQQRPVETLNELYAAVVKNLGELAGLSSADVFINVTPSPSTNWWADGRVLDPETGFDTRIAAARTAGITEAAIEARA